ncbi:MAG: hypothetical protein IPG46_15460 [Actinobacteria bacterium]|nr:hypothetical protein [Actinomycetota bacterium]
MDTIQTVDRLSNSTDVRDARNPVRRDSVFRTPSEPQCGRVYASPFERAAILTFDGVGEWATSTVGWGAGNRIEIKRETAIPHSLGLFYSTITSVCGFAVNDDEYKLMGLTPYGSPGSATLRDRVIRIDDDGAVTLDQRWFDYRSGRRMAHPRRRVARFPPLHRTTES